MPIIQINLAEGRSAEQRLAAMAAITEAVVRTLDVRPEQVRIQINEVSPDNFTIGGETMAMRAARESGTPRKG